MLGERVDALRRSGVLGQLVRFALVGGLCALIYSAVYLPVATLLLPRRLAVLAVPPAFAAAVSVGYLLHSGWSFRGHGARDEGSGQKMRFVGVQAAGMVLNLLYAGVLSGVMGYPAWVPLVPAVLVTPLVTFAINRAWVFGRAMDRIVYDRMAAHDSTHWWYRARREVLADYLARYGGLPADARILEIGCGTGHNLPMLARFGRVEAIEIDPAARAVAAQRLGRAVGDAPLPELPDVERGAYDLVAVLDVVEHIADDRAALSAMRTLLRPGGKLLIAVPAHQWMWSAHDEVNHHHRRYSRRSLDAAIRAAGMRAERPTYMNSLLFPLAAAARLAGRLTGRDDSDDSPPPAPLNRAFEAMFRLERHLVGRVPMTPGLSILTLAVPA